MIKPKKIKPYILNVILLSSISLSSNASTLQVELSSFTERILTHLSFNYEHNDVHSVLGQFTQDDSTLSVIYSTTFFSGTRIFELIPRSELSYEPLQFDANVINSGTAMLQFTAPTTLNDEMIPSSSLQLNANSILATAGVHSPTMIDMIFENGDFLLDYNFKTSSIKVDFQLGIPSVPIPAAAWLFGSGLVGLMSFSRKKSINVSTN